MITLSVRGAVSVDRNTSESIQSAVVKLVSLLEKENGIREEDLTMILFSVTADLTALNPAAAYGANTGYRRVITPRQLYKTETVDKNFTPLPLRFTGLTAHLRQQTSLQPIPAAKAATLRFTLHPLSWLYRSARQSLCGAIP